MKPLVSHSNLLPNFPRVTTLDATTKKQASVVANNGDKGIVMAEAEAGSVIANQI